MTSLLLSIGSVLSFIMYIALAILVLLFMILIHELGHYTAGKLLKFKINEFSIGFGKAIFQKKKKNGEVFSIRIFPLGGFCAFEGEDEENKNVEGAFNNQKAWKRLIVLFMGAFFNFLSAILFAVIFLMAFGYHDKVQVRTIELPQTSSNISSEVWSNYNENNWLKEGDVIHAVNGKETNFVYDEYFTNLTENYKVGEKFTISVYRKGKNIDLDIFKSWMRVNSKDDNFYGKLFELNGEYKYAIKTENGTFKVYNTKEVNKVYELDSNNLITIKTIVNEQEISSSYKLFVDEVGNPYLTSTKIGITTQNYKYGFFEAIGQSFAFCFGWAWKILIILWQLISGQMALKNMGGTVTTVVTIAQVTQTNIASLLLLIPLISINLAVFNLLPFPALDGARMVFVGIEMIRKKPINRKIEGMIHFVGLMVLLAFVVLVDILHFVL